MPRTSVFLLGSGPGAAAIRATLTDLAALGLIDRFHWLDAAAGPGTVATITPADGGGHAVREDGVARTLDAERPDRALLIALDEQDDRGSTIDPSSVDAWTRAIDGGLSCDVHRIHLVLTRLELPAEEPVRLPAYPRLVLSPEDSLAPGEPVTAQRRADGPDALARYAAPAIAGLAGLWRGSAAVPVIDGADGPIGTGDPGHVRLVRVFHRRIDTTTVEDALRARAIDVTGGLPQPAQSGPVQVQVGGYDEEMVDLVVGTFTRETHRRVLSGLRPYEDAGSSTIGADAAVDAFLSDFFGFVVGKPSDWGRAVAGDAGRGYARAVQRALYGDDSRVEVMVGSHSGKGGRGSVDDIGRASASFRHEFEETDGRALTVGPETVTADVWQAYVDTAMTMIDGHDRAQSNGNGAGMPVNVRNSDGPVVVSRPDLVVPDPSEAFDGSNRMLERLAGASLRETTVAPYDPYGAARYAETLTWAAGQNTDKGIQDLNRRFAAWRERHSRSFAWRFGEAISGMIDEAQERMDWARAEFEDASARLEEAERGDRGDLSLSGKLRGLWIIWGVATLAIAYMTAAWHWADASGDRPLTFGDWLPPALRWNHGLFWLAVTTFVVLGAGMVTYAKVTKELRARDERRRELAHRHEVASHNVVAAAADVEKCAHAYNQFLSWSAIIGRVVSRPYGAAGGSASRVRLPQEGLPRSTALAEVPVDGAFVDDSVRGVRAGLFPGSWAQARLDAYVGAARRRAEESGMPLPSFGGLAAQAGHGSGSSLDRLARAILADDADRDRGFASEWRAAMERFARSGGAGRLRSGLTTHVDGAPRTVAYDDFVRGVASADAAGAPGTGFLHEAMSELGAVRGGVRVDPAASHVVRGAAGDGPGGALSEGVTLVQYGPSVPAEYVTRRDSADDPAAGGGRGPGAGDLGLGGFRLD
ncbi:hypothetical protein [Corynebacterium sp. 335C]